MTHEKNTKEHQSVVQHANGASLEEINNTVVMPSKGGFWRKLAAYSGPGVLVAVGYMDPGNWITSIAGGAQYAYALLSVILISSIVAMLLQSMSAKLGIVTGMDLAQATRKATSKPVGFILWIITELAIMATDIAEVIGGAIALHLLFGMPLIVGVLITALDVMLLLLALGIVGATVMPHNLYLHSSIIQARQYKRTAAGKREAIKFSTIDSNIQLTIAMVVNCLLLILGAAMFYGVESDLGRFVELYNALSDNKIVGAVASPILSTLFAVALLASGQNSTITGTLSGQIVMEGFIKMKIPMWLRRVVTRLLAIIPVIIMVVVYNGQDAKVEELLIYTQVFLSVALPFAIIPLTIFTSSKKMMGEFANPKWVKYVAWFIAIVLTILNVYLIYSTFQ